MAQFIKAYDEGDGVVFEMAVKGGTEAGAKSRATLSLLGRRPGEVTALQKIWARKMPSTNLVGPNVVSEYRVMIKLERGENLRDKLFINSAIDELERLL